MVELVRKAAGNKIGRFTKNEIMEPAPSTGKTSVENALKKLLREKAIEHHGSGKSTFYTRND